MGYSPFWVKKVVDVDL